jgi:hypothetical protein
VSGPEPTFEQLAAKGCFEPSLPTAVLQHFASAENLPYVDGPLQTFVDCAANGWFEPILLKNSNTGPSGQF